MKKRIEIKSGEENFNIIEGDEMVLAIMDGKELTIYAQSSLETKITVALRILEEAFKEDEELTAKLMTADAENRSKKPKQPIDLALRRQRKNGNC